MFAQQNGEFADLTYRHQVKRVFEGNGVIEGCGVTIGSSGSELEFDVASGAVQFDGSRQEVPTQTVSADAGGAENRFDVIYVAESGDAYVLRGDEVEVVPPDTEGRNIVVLAVVEIPANASGTGDLSSSDISDRRLPSISATGGGDRQTERFPITAMQNEASVSHTLMAQPGQTLEMYQWGLVHVDNGVPQAAPTGVEVQLVDPNNSVVESVSSLLETGEPLFSVDITGDTVQVYQLRLMNNSGSNFSDPEGLAATFEFALLD